MTKFNAHYIHGKTWGEMEPKPEDTVYESLYPQVRTYKHDSVFVMNDNK